jgi:tetratricopeptide (TPR) repeat protein
VAGTFVDVDEGLAGTARHQLALLYRGQGRADEAEQLWRELLATQPEAAAARACLAELLLEQGRWDELEQEAAGLEANPARLVEVLVLRGRACLARRDFVQAQRLLRQAIARAPEAVPPRLYLTHVLLQDEHEPGPAEVALRELLTLDPGQAAAWQNLTVLLRRQGRLAEAVAVCRSARVYRADDRELLLLHGLLLHEAGDLAGAEGCLARLLEQEAAGSARQDARARQRRLTARHNLALVCRRHGRLAEAERHWRAALAEMPEWSEAWVGLGELYLMQGRLADAEAVLSRLEATPQGAAAAVLLRARLLWQRGDHAAARQVLEVEATRAPEAVEPRRLLSYVLLDEDGDPEAADAALRAVLALVPRDVEALHNLTLLRRRQRAGPEAA